MKAKTNIILTCIVFLAIFLRFYELGKNPPSLTWDEAAWGYNAYSLGTDGKDEFGRFLPYDYLESFGDFKPPVYAYLDILPVKLFGLSEFSTRFPSAFFGVLTVLLTYFLTKRIFPLRFDIALLASFFLAVSPWHINLSRAAFEANVASFFIVAAILFFLKGLEKKNWYIIISILFFVISMYTFNTARIVSPMLVIVLGLGFYKQLLRMKKKVVAAAVVGLLIFLPNVPFLLSPQASLRFREVNIFSDGGIIKTLNQEVDNDKGAWWSKILHNRRFAYGAEYMRHYLDNLSPSFLFIKGDGNPKFSTQDVGQLYLFELPFLILGILFLFKKREGSWWIIPLWTIVSILPAATARETPHALRIENTLPTFQIITATGLIVFLESILNMKYEIVKVKIKYIICCLFLLFFIFNFLYYMHGYYVHYAREYSREWQYGYKESIEYIKSVEHQYDQIRVTTSLGRPYIYTAFYIQTDPKTFRESVIVERDPFGFVTVLGFSKYRFAHNLSTIKSKTRKVLYIDVPERVHPKGDVVKRFYLLNGELALVAYRL